MDIVRFDLNHLPEKERKLSLALGNFDALHRGHQKVFVETALGAEGASAALLFAKPFGCGKAICSIEDKIRLSSSSRLDALYILENDETLFEMTPSRFIEEVLLPLGTTRVVVGEDFRFGKGKGGGIEELKAHFGVEVVPLLEHEGKKISSRSIRNDIEEGKLDHLPFTLGRRYEVQGKVVPGLQKGRTIGFPTVNLAFDFPYVLPRNGVYLGIVYLSGIAYKSIINVGKNPTVGALDHPQVEAHLLDYDGDAYGKRAYVSFYSFLREEKTFPSLNALGEQLGKDKEACEVYFAGMC